MDARKLDPQLADERSWEELPEAMERLRNRDVAGKVAVTIGDQVLFARSQLVGRG